MEPAFTLNDKNTGVALKLASDYTPLINNRMIVCTLVYVPVASVPVNLDTHLLPNE